MVREGARAVRPLAAAGVPFCRAHSPLDLMDYRMCCVPGTHTSTKAHRIQLDNVLIDTGCLKNAPLWFCLISLNRNILEGCCLFHIKGGIHRSIWSTKTFLNNIREPRYKRNNMEYHTSKFLNIEQSSVLETDTQYCFPYISVLPCCAELGLNLKNAHACYL